MVASFVESAINDTALRAPKLNSSFGVFAKRPVLADIKSALASSAHGSMPRSSYAVEQ